MLLNAQIFSTSLLMLINITNKSTLQLHVQNVFINLGLILNKFKKTFQKFRGFLKVYSLLTSSFRKKKEILKLPNMEGHRRTLLSRGHLSCYSRAGLETGTPSYVATPAQRDPSSYASCLTHSSGCIHLLCCWIQIFFHFSGNLF